LQVRNKSLAAMPEHAEREESMTLFEPIEVSKLVDVEGVGLMQRVELTSPDGEVLEIHYLWPVIAEFSDAMPTTVVEAGAEPVLS
jgi:hypothetical protein